MEKKLVEMLKNSLDVISPKYKIKGKVFDYGFVIKLCFEYESKQVEIALSRSVIGGDAVLAEMACLTIDSYVDNLKESVVKRKLQLHCWYVTEEGDEDTRYKIAHGIVTGHPRITDSTFIYTSEIEDIMIDKTEGIAFIKTKNSVYSCPLEYCLFRKQDKAPELVPDYDWIKENYKGKIRYPEIEEGNVLLVLSNFCPYYFHSLYYKPVGASKAVSYSGCANVGTYQDSFLISTEEDNIDLRYFPHYQNIEFYSVRLGEGKSLFLENIGDITLYAKTRAGLMKLNPGERKEVKKDNAEKEKTILPDGDLYPAGIVE